MTDKIFAAFSKLNIRFSFIVAGLLLIFATSLALAENSTNSVSTNAANDLRAINAYQAKFNFWDVRTSQSNSKTILPFSVSHSFWSSLFSAPAASTPPSSAGALDVAFDGDGKVTTGLSEFGQEAAAVAIQSDGKIIVAGSFHNGSNYDFVVVRYNADGSLDNSFDGDGKTNTDFGGDEKALAIAIQPDGRIIVAGYTQNGSNKDFALARYDTDGTLDNSFTGDGKTTTNFGAADDEARGVAVQPDGKIVAAGKSDGDFALARYNGNTGSLDTSFDGDGKATTDLSEGSAANAVVIQSDGRIVAVGETKVFVSFQVSDHRGTAFALARYNSNGSLDTSFGGGGKVIEFITTHLDTGPQGLFIRDKSGVAKAAAIQSDGKIIAAGYAVKYRDPHLSQDISHNDFVLARFNTDGSFDTSFSDNGVVLTDVGSKSDDTAFSVTVQSDGKIIAAGKSNDDFALTRYNVDGSIDPLFSGDGRQTTGFGDSQDRINGIAVQSNGRIVAAGYANEQPQDIFENSISDFALARYTTSGSLDGSFGDGDGKVTTDLSRSYIAALSAAVQPDGKVVAAGYIDNGISRDFMITRYNANGSLDTSFDGDGKVITDFNNDSDIATAASIQSDGKIIVAGYSRNGTDDEFALARYNTNGSLDASFGHFGKLTFSVTPGSDYISAIAVQSNGKIVAAGYAHNGGTDYDFALVRINADGQSLDNTFDGDGIALMRFSDNDDILKSIAILSNGKIIAAGSTYNGANLDFALTRFNSNGAVDTTFGSSGRVVTTFGSGDEQARSVAVQSDDKIIAGGFTGHIAIADFALARYDKDGILDNTFGSGGKVITDFGNGADVINGVVIQSDGKIIAAGYAHNGQNRDFALARYNSGGSLDADFDSDGKVTTDFGRNDNINGAEIQSNGKVVAAGETSATQDKDVALARYLTDASQATPTVRANLVYVTESNTGPIQAVITVSLSHAHNQTVTVNYATESSPAGEFNPHPATPGSDYVAASGTLTFNPGETSKQVGVTVNDDTQVEPDETFILRLSNPVNAVLFGGVGVVFIRDNDAPNNVPTISNIGDQTINEDASTGAISFTVGDTETPAANLTLSSSSSNTALVPNNNIVFGGSGANRTVTVTPAANHNGTATITVAVTDEGGATNNDTFVLTVNAVNDSPTISDILSRTMNANTSTGAIPFTIGDMETPVGNLTLSRSSSNTTLVPNNNIVFGGSGANRTVTVTPATNQSGNATITVTVTDPEGLTSSDTFVLTVYSAGMPTISDISDRTIDEDENTGVINFTVDDVFMTQNSLTVSGSSSNETLVPRGNIVFAGSGSNRMVAVAPAANQHGTATITITVTDPDGLSASDTFLLTVNSVNDAPTISDIGNQTINTNANTGALAFTIGDIETAAGSLTLSRSSSNTTLVPNANIIFGGSGANRTVTVTPAANQNGTATITVTVTDADHAAASDTFILTVNTIQPSISVNDVSVTEGNSGTKQMGFTVSLSQSSSQTVTVSYSTSDGTATAGSDYVAIPATTLTFNPNETSKTVNATINGDPFFEPNETLNLNLSNPTNATISDNQGVGTITNDDNGIVVNSFAQSPGANGDCTLGEAIQAANTNAAVDGCAAGSSSGTDTIMLPTGTYTLDTINFSTGGGPNGLPGIESNITIQGAGAASTIIERSSGAGTPDFRFFAINPNGFGDPNIRLTINDVTLRRGRVGNFAGGAIYPNGNGSLDGSLFVNNCILSNNVSTGFYGGAIGNNFGYKATINNSTFTSNSASSGGAISGSDITVTNSTFTNNTAQSEGGAIQMGYQSTLAISGSTFTNNRITVEGGGGAVSGYTINISDSIFSGNSTSTVGGTRGGAIRGGYVTITRSAITNNTASGAGGGISNGASPNTFVDVSNSTISGNTAGGAGGGIDGAAVTLNNSTVSGNFSTDLGGGVSFSGGGSGFNLNNATITNNTANNQGGGIFGSGSMNIRNSIIAGNINPHAPDCGGTFGAAILSQGYNLIGNNQNCNFTPATGDIVGTSSQPIDPLLGALQDNGGTTLTHALLSNSPAIDAGNPATPDGTDNNCLAADQRGINRPIDGNGDGTVRCDIGAVEMAANVVVPTISVNDISVAEGNSGTNQMAFTVLLSAASTQTVTVSFSTSNGTATAGSDYVTVPATTLTFNPNETSKTVNVTINGDTTVEPDETLNLNLSNPTNATISDSQGIGTITNDDAAPTCVQVSVPNNLTALRNTTLTVPINVSETTNQGIISFDFTLTYNSTVLTPLAVPFDTNGTLSNGFTITTNTTTPGQIVVSGFNSAALSGQGTLINLKFNVIGSPTATGSLNFSAFQFNENTPCATTTNGAVQVIYGTIAGAVVYGTASSTVYVPGVTLTAAGTSNITTTTNVSGNYNLDGFGAGAYTVTPSKAGEVNGIASLDASLIARYAAGLETPNANQTAAADVSGNGTLTSYDAALVAQYLINISNPGNLAGTWRFNPASRSYANAEANQTNQNYTAILMGDVTGNWTPPSPFAEFEKQETQPAANAIQVSLPSRTVATTQIFTVPITVGDLTSRGFWAYDAEISFDPAVLQLDSAEPVEKTGTISSQFSLAANSNITGRLIISAYGIQPLEGAGTLLNLKFRAIGQGGTVSPLTFQRFMFNEDATQSITTNGQVQVLSPTAATVSIGGRVLTPDGRGISNASITLMETDGRTRTAVSGSFGYYRFDDVQVGQTIVISIVSKRFIFTPSTQVLNVTEDNGEMNFVSDDID